MGDRRAQVAERPLRLRARPLRHPESHRAAMSSRAVVPDPGRGRAACRPVRLDARVLPPGARLPVYAALRSLGRTGSPSSSSAAAHGAHASPTGSPSSTGVEVLNEVVLNQVLVRFEPTSATRRALARVQHAGTCLAERHHLGRPQGDPRLRLQLADRGRGDRPRQVAGLRRLRWPGRRPGRAGPRLPPPPPSPEGSRSRSARRECDATVSTPSRARADERDPRSPRCGSRTARTGSRRGRRPTRRARSRPPRRPPTRWRSPCCACCAGGRRPGAEGSPLDERAGLTRAATPIVSANTTSSAPSKRDGLSASRVRGRPALRTGSRRRR